MESQENQAEQKKVHFTEITDTLFDALLASGVSTNAIAIALYILRHTEGWQQDIVALSADEFMHGRRKTNGERYDAGLPIKHHMTLAAGLEELGKAGIIFEIDTGNKRGVKSWAFNLKFRTRDPQRVAELGTTDRYHMKQVGKDFVQVEPEPRQKLTTSKKRGRKPGQKLTRYHVKN